MKKRTIALTLAATAGAFSFGALTAPAPHHTLTGKACWNEKNVEMPSGLEMICGDKAKAVNRVGNFTPYTDAALDATTTTKAKKWTTTTTQQPSTYTNTRSTKKQTTASTRTASAANAGRISHSVTSTTFRPMTEQDRKNFDRIPDNPDSGQYADPDNHEHIKDGAQLSAK